MPVEKAFSLKSVLAEYDIDRLRGTVLDETTRSESKVEGTIGGGGSVGGANSPVQGVHGRIKTSITRYQNIFLKDEDGSEHVIEFENFVVPCRAGNVITLWGLYGGDWFHVVNESTGKSYTNKFVFNTRFFPVFISLAILLLSALVGYFTDNLFFGVLIGLLLAYVSGKIICMIRRREVLKRISMA